MNEQHYVEWFSGKTLTADLYNQNFSGGTSGMEDEIDGGFFLQKNAQANGGSALSFNAWIRPFSKTGSAIHMVMKGSQTSECQLDAGLSDTKGSQTNCMLFYHDNSVESGYYSLTTAGNASITHTATTKAIDTIWHHHFLEQKSASAEYSIEDTLEATRTANLSQADMMLHIESYKPGTAVFKYNIRFLEIYNT